MAGESAAWQRLQSAVIPQIARIARSHEGMRSRGLGLGLFIVREIVHAHGGSVSVESSEAAGTTFRVRIPRVARA